MSEVFSESLTVVDMQRLLSGGQCFAAVQWSWNAIKIPIHRMRVTAIFSMEEESRGNFAGVYYGSQVLACSNGRFYVKFKRWYPLTEKADDSALGFGMQLATAIAENDPSIWSGGEILAVTRSGHRFLPVRAHPRIARTITPESEVYCVVESAEDRLKMAYDVEASRSSVPRYYSYLGRRMVKCSTVQFGDLTIILR